MTLHKVLNGYIATTQEKKFTKISYHLYIITFTLIIVLPCYFILEMTVVCV